MQKSALAGAGFWVTGVVSDLYGDNPPTRPVSANGRINLGIIGCGGQGAGNWRSIARTDEMAQRNGVNVIALCDVDDRKANEGRRNEPGAYDRFPQATKYKDFRIMLERERNLDAVIVSTPDNTHCMASVMAMRLGKHCYTEKPLTHDVYEARLMKQVARERRVATQMGNMGTGENGFRRGVDVIRSGALGDVREVHVWTNRPIWPQGMKAALPAQQVPQGVDWDLWIGPAPMRAYNENYMPFKWRGWWDFGTGAIGDMACHTMNLPFMGLRLGAPTAVSAVPVRQDINTQSPPEGLVVSYEFPARGNLPPVHMTWYERVVPPRQLFRGMGDNARLSGSGCLLVGSRCSMYSPSDYGSEQRRLPDGNFNDVQIRDPLPRSIGHREEWLRAIRGGPAPLSNFVDYAAQLTETALLGNVAALAQTRILWDAESGRVTNSDVANRFIRREYRKGWSL
jgi:predicted dehydrogenase